MKQCPYKYIFASLFAYKKWSKKGEALLLLLFNFALEYVIRKVQRNQVRLNEMGYTSF
jgi:hypothetical protein